MAFTTLRFPEDIKWKRLCVTESMMDPTVCDRLRPLRWRSSAALFTYEPPEDEQLYPDHLVSYLKVVATITGYQPDGEEIGVPDDEWEDLPGIADFENVLAEYYPCYGALLEVVVGPPENADGAPANRPLAQYPFIASIEPQKRELFELVSETGEQTSRSVQGVNIKQGSTTTDSTESMDVFGGFGMQSTYAGTGGGSNLSGQWGTKDLNSTERVDLKTTDALEEMRNTLSRTTNLTQMYSLLQSFHTGTNRAVFLLQPRPHIVQHNATFINGPRQLEGVQEVFLVVMRPKGQEHPCVLVDLETAHLGFRSEFTTEKRIDTHSLHILAKAEDRGGSLGDDSHTEEVSDSTTYVPPAGWEIEGYEIASVNGQRIEEHHVDWGPIFLTIFGTVTWRFEDRTFGNLLLDGTLDVTVRINLRNKTPTKTGEVETLFLTGRRLCCCANGLVPLPGRRPPITDWVVGELDLSRYKLRFTSGPATGETLLETRRAVSILAREMRELSTGPKRYPTGEVHFFETNLFQRRLALHLRAHGARYELTGAEVPAAIRNRFGPKRRQPFTVADYLSIPAKAVARASGEDLVMVQRRRLQTALRSFRPAK
jgi:hypothetical protein